MSKEEFEIEAPAERATSEEALETALDLHKWLNDPAVRKQFKEINKDVPLSNLSEGEMWIARNFADFALQLKKLKLNKAAEYFRFQLFFLLNVSLGKGGFARKLISTSILKYDIKKSDEHKRIFNLRRPKKK